MSNKLKFISVLCYGGPFIIYFLDSNEFIVFNKNTFIFFLAIFIANVFFVLIAVFIKMLAKKIIEKGEVVSVRYLNSKELSEDNGNCELTVRFVFSGSIYVIKSWVTNLAFFKKGSIVNVHVNAKDPQKSIVLETIGGGELKFLISFLSVSVPIIWQMITYIEKR